MDDIVVDTNVFVHAQDPSQERFDASRRFLNELLSATTLLCVDDGFDIVEARNTSVMCSEYLEHLVQGSSSYAVLTTLASSKRVATRKRIPSELAAHKFVKQSIRKPPDRAFLGVAFNTLEKVLVSHDFEDFQLPKRLDIEAQIGVKVVEACDCEGVL